MRFLKSFLARNRKCIQARASSQHAAIERKTLVARIDELRRLADGSDPDDTALMVLQSEVDAIVKELVRSCIQSGRCLLKLDRIMYRQKSNDLCDS